MYNNRGIKIELTTNRILNKVYIHKKQASSLFMSYEKKRDLCTAREKNYLLMMKFQLEIPSIR